MIKQIGIYFWFTRETLSEVVGWQSRKLRIYCTLYETKFCLSHGGSRRSLFILLYICLSLCLVGGQCIYFARTSTLGRIDLTQSDDSGSGTGCSEGDDATASTYETSKNFIVAQGEEMNVR